jgi:hypothetical protein
MNERGHFHEDDVALLRGVFDRGARLTKPEARARYGIEERRFRAAVSELRRRGYPVVSFSEQGNTYRKAVDVQELDHFINELRSRRDDLNVQVMQLETTGARRSLNPQMRMAI